MTTTWIPGMTLEAVKREVILSALAHFEGNKTQTAEALGVSVRSLRGKVKSYIDEGTKVPVDPTDPEFTPAKPAPDPRQETAMDAEGNESTVTTRGEPLGADARGEAMEQGDGTFITK